MAPPTTLFAAQSLVRAIFKPAGGSTRYLPLVQAWDDKGNPWIVGVPVLGHDMTTLVQANVLTNYKGLRPDVDALSETDPADAVQPTKVQL